jgi:hypothetical protein
MVRRGNRAILARALAARGRGVAGQRPSTPLPSPRRFAHVATKFILAALALVFLAAAARRRTRASPDTGGQARTWLLIGVIFAAVSAWLWYSE